MAPGFLSKLVKPHPRDHSHSRGSSSASTASSSDPARARVLSSPGPLPSINVHKLTSEFAERRSHDARRSSPNSSIRSGSTQPSVTVIPPSPQSHVGSFPGSREPSVKEPSEHGSKRGRRPSTISINGVSSPDESALPTPTPGHPNTLGASETGGKRPLTPSSSTGNLRSLLRRRSRSIVGSREPSPQSDMRRTSSAIPHKQSDRPPLPSPPPPPVTASSTQQSSSRARAATSPASQHPPNGHIRQQHSETMDTPNGTAAPTSYTDSHNIVDSPTNIPPEYIESSPTTSPIQLTPTQSFPSGPAPNSALLSPSGQRRDSDAASVISTASTRKRRLWSKGSGNKEAPVSPKRKPSNLASALAGAGMSMASPGSSNHVSPPPSPPARNGAPVPGRNGSLGSAYRGRSPALGGMHMSRASIDGVTSSSPSHTRQGSLAVPQDGADDAGSVYLSSAGSDDEEDSDDEALLNDLSANDIPVTGFAVASNKRNADFHDLFPAVPEGDYLIEDYGCALQREILIQGRIYISENHICFHANIFGWITDLIIPIYEIISLEKKMTAFVIPNALQITTRAAKYTFASFLARDTVYDVIYNIWRLARPEDGTLGAFQGAPEEGPMPGAVPGVIADVADGIVAGVPARKATQCACGKEGEHLSEVAMEAIYPGTPERIYNLMFASGFIKDFMRVDQKLDDIQISDWVPMSSDNPKCLTRNMSYIKPLSGSIGPRQTKCEIKDETLHCDYEDYVTTLTTTRTPDVPSGGVFAVKTRTCVMWASAVSTRVIVTTQVDWTGRSFIKGIIEKSAIDGQKTYHNELDKAMREYIREHQSEFIPAGVDPAVVAEEVQSPTSATTTPQLDQKPLSEDEARKSREKERNQRGLQWAYDTFEGAYGVAKQSTNGALELVRDAWDQSTSSTILYFIITFLVISNIWTLMIVGRREDIGRRKEIRKMEEREKWVEGIVTTLWDELAAGKLPHGAPQVQMPPAVRPDGSWRSEVADINKVLDAIEERVSGIRSSLKDLD